MTEKTSKKTTAPKKPAKKTAPESTDDKKQKKPRIQRIIPQVTGVKAVHQIGGHRVKGNMTNSVLMNVMCEARNLVRGTLYNMGERKTAQLGDFAAAFNSRMSSRGVATVNVEAFKKVKKPVKKVEAIEAGPPGDASAAEAVNA